MDQLARPLDLARFAGVRDFTEHLASGLTPEDQCVQSMPDASPAKWHRAHTTWFFEQFILLPHMQGYRSFDVDFQFLFNSYYESVGSRHPRPQRGMITRPSADAVTAYRAHVDAAMRKFLASGAGHLAELLELGLQHEQQHQELMVTDITHAFAQNCLSPAAMPFWQPPPCQEGEARYIGFPGGMVEIGHAGEGFCFDNETPRHRVWLEPYRLADRLVRNRDWLDFIADGGYRDALLWMSDGWALAQAEGWEAPLYWRRHDEGWQQFGPAGLAPLDLAAPVRHISWYEADAFARWSGARLPTEAEWEAASADHRLVQMMDSVWQWTASAYLPYPGFRPVPGAVGEYNGKFMINQMVLRGGSAATSPGHGRLSYRNFFHPGKRWQFTGLRLAHNESGVMFR
jgi:ergothioneine biosynthesis protein EgtB